jgi:DNA polymerase bacteriophage-type
MILYLDTETYSPVNLFTGGLARYCTQVEVTILTWAIDDGPVHVWDVTRNPETPPALLVAAEQCDKVIAHNAQFDREVVGAALPDLAELLAGKWYCTMAQAFRHGLPGGLDKLCTVFKVRAEHAKLKGRELVLLFCKPDKHGKRATRETHPEQWADFLAYAKQDIVAMREVRRKLPTWNDTPFELSLWDLDQTINLRGICVDVPFAKAAVRATTAEQKRLGARTQKLTYGTVDRTTQRDRLLCFLFAEFGVDLPDLKADTIERRLEDPELPDYVKELLRIRQQASKASTSKYKRILEMNLAGRMYFLLQIYGAYRTGRWGGRNFQPQNLPRPTHSFEEVLEAIDAVMCGSEDLVLDSVMESMSSAIRSVLCAAKGRKLVISDLANIEGRKLAWIAGEDWKLDAFRDYDAGIGPDLYKLAYARAFNIDPADVDKWMRQIGKVLELAMGYAGGVGAFVAMAATYGLDLEELAERARPAIPRKVLLDAEETWQWATKKGRTMGLSQNVYVVCEALKVLWRNAHPATVQLWADVETAVRCAIINKGEVFTAGRLQFDRKGAWLRMRLPSGRYLLYPNPRLVGGMQEIQFAAWNVYKKCWKHETTYGGKLVENACQGSARDIMAYAMPAAEAAGFPIVLTVHDELVTEPLDLPERSSDELSTILSTNPPWAEGLTRGKNEDERILLMHYVTGHCTLCGNTQQPGYRPTKLVHMPQRCCEG